MLGNDPLTDTLINFVTFWHAVLIVTAYGLIVGLPLSMDGTAGPAAQAARDWTHALSSATGLPAAMWDERLSSAAVNRFMTKAADLSRAKRAEVVDRAAAAWLLQAALDAGAWEDRSPHRDTASGMSADGTATE